ncbi:MAG TPA: DUF1015 family protein, partial [Pyrinomonadaceae bacterium]|nr:DUF1015 family protein [Pyrinomonadaceae bacterium]
NPLSFLRVTRPEAEPVGGRVLSATEVNEAARLHLEKLIKDGIFLTESEPSVYIYRLESGGHSQTGIVACCSLDEYEKGFIKRHEKTRPDKVEDRTKHMLELRAQTGLIFLALRGTTDIHVLIEDETAREPLYDFRCLNDVRQTVWKAVDTRGFVEAFAKVPVLYIADGHHRIESAYRARGVLRSQNPAHVGTEDYNYVIAGIFPAEDLRILPYNRVVADLNGFTNEQLIARVSESFVFTGTGKDTPENHGEICMYLGRQWHTLKFAVDYIREPDPIERLDVSILQNYILGPVLGIKDPRTDERIGFVGGSRGTRELANIVDRGEASVAFSLFPTTMADLLAVSDADEIMPPKSTWFEPKLKDGLLVHMI